MPNNALRSLIDSLVASIECDAQQLHQTVERRAACAGAAPVVTPGQASGLACPRFGQDDHQHAAHGEGSGAIDDPVGQGAAAVR